MDRNSELPPKVAAVIDGHPPAVRRRLLAVRRLLFKTAEQIDGVGPITETLKWGEPAYLTDATKSGTTVRIGYSERFPDSVGVYVHCQTSLVGDFRRLHADDLSFVDNRGILIPLRGALPTGPLRECFKLALTYKLRKKKKV